MPSQPPKRSARAGARTAPKARPPRARAALGRRRPEPPAPAVPSAEELARAAAAKFGPLWQDLLSRMRATPLAPAGEVVVHLAIVARPSPAWVYLSAGLAGRGLELVLRVARGKEEATPPPWIEASFRELVAAAGGPGSPPPSAEQVLIPTLPIAPGAGSDLGCYAFTPDPTLAPHLPAGSEVTPLLAVGLTRDEERLVREWSPQGLLEVLGRADPALLTDPERASLLQSPRARTAIEQRVAREGSSLGAMRAERCEVQASGGKTTWRLSARAVDTLVSLLKGRTGHQRPFTIHAPHLELAVVPADHAEVSVAGERATLALSQTAARLLRATLRPAPGRYPMDAVPGLTIEVV